MALLQFVVFGSIFGALVYFRGARPTAGVDPGARVPLLERLQRPIAGLERILYDWRARELGRISHPAEDVVLVAVDDETLANARQDRHPAVASRPWPRALVGRMANRLEDDGASHVLLDLPFDALSPHPGGDDASFRALAERDPGKVVLGFGWSEEPLPPVAPSLLAFRIRISTEKTRKAAYLQVRRLLEDRRPAFLIPLHGAFEVWAGVEGDDEARALVHTLGAEAGTLREFVAADRAYQVTPTDLFVALAEVQVRGIDPDRLPRVRTLSPPVAPLLGDRLGYGAVTLAPDDDGEVRGLYQLVAYTSEDGVVHVLPSAPLASAIALARTEGAKGPDAKAAELRWSNGLLHVGSRFTVPMDETGFSLIRWDAEDTGRDARGSLKRAIPAWRVLVDLFDREAGAPVHYQQELKDKAVVLADGTVGSPFAVSSPIGPEVARGAVLGQALANVLDSEGVRRAPPRRDLEATLLMALLGGLLAVGFNGFLRSMGGLLVYGLAFLAAAGGYLFFVRGQFVEHQLWLAAAGPLLAFGVTFALTTVSAVRTEREVRDFISSALGRYVSPEVSRAVFRNVKLIHPERREVSLLYCDLEGFGGACESLSPQAVAALLNAFVTEATSVVRETHGQVEYVGDSVIAFWGAPVRTDRHAQLACQSALELQAALARRGAAWEKRFGRRIEFRVGVATGEVVVGDLGSDFKANYTAIGDAVGRAGRLERANRMYGTFGVMDARTVELASDAFVFREIDRVAFRGEPQLLFELLAPKGQLPRARVAALNEFQEGLALYRGRRFEDALAHFSRNGDDPVSALYVERCRALIASPPPSDWTGLGELRRGDGRG